MKIFEQLGRVALGTRVRFFGEKIADDATKIYSLYDIDMNPKWFPVFYVLSQDEERTITSIADEIGHSHASVSKIVKEMMKARLILEKTSRQDKRRTLVSLSKSGQDMARKIEAQYLDVKAAVEELSAQSKNDLWKALEEWEYLFAQKSLFARVAEQKKKRESAKVEIVPYSRKYRSAFLELNEEWIRTYFKIEQADRDALGDPEGYILKRGGFIFIALLNNKPVGVCALIKRDDPTYPYELAKMAVAPEARGKNIGWLLGNAVVEKAKELKAKKLFLESNTILKPAISLYEKLGFKKVVGPPTPYERCNIQMELKLK
ncbi:GNAT family N-acetyltransferase [Bdellovibrio bacteriovorus]|uniref:bifunctional helix-turn-helix transcriptional regulator/GNAT family N-acetyltransferase n=1 Tax=Bdellovibrio bacteriovorus TaxID=959 RepID=UPI0035A659FE